jgi:hypothetical protein
MTRLQAAAAAILVLAGCASPFNAWNIAPGTSREQVLARSGTPTRVVALPAGGERLQYSLQPMGRFAWMVDLDPAGKVVSARQVLTERDFQRIVPGEWRREDVEREFGPPAWVDRVTSWNGPVMTYRWQDVQRSDMFYWVYLDPQGVVRRAHPGMEYVNAPSDRN